jgi:hypothetical protein
MSVDLRNALPGVIAVVFLVVIGVQTRDALKRSGAWTRARGAVVHVDPYANLDRQLETMSRATVPTGLRDPFTFAGTGLPAPPVDTGASRPRPRQPDPVLTAIVADQDPRAVILYEGRNYSVKTGDLFAEFRVMSVTRDEVVLDGGGRSLVLRRPERNVPSSPR